MDTCSTNPNESTINKNNNTMSDDSSEVMIDDVLEGQAKLDNVQASDKRKLRVLARKNGGNWWAILCSFEGSILPGVFLHPLFWASVGIYIGCRFDAVRNNGPTTPASVLALGSLLLVVGVLLAASLAIYTGLALKRYLGAFQVLEAVSKVTMDVAVLLLGTPKWIEENRPGALRIVRYLGVAQLSACVAAVPLLSASNFSKPVSEKHALADAGDLRYIKTTFGKDAKAADCARCALAGAVAEANEAERYGMITPERANLLTEKVLLLGSLLADLQAYHSPSALSLPLSVGQLLSTAVVFYLPTCSLYAAYGTGGSSEADIFWPAEVLAGLLVLSQAVLLLGLGLLSERLQLPLGGSADSLPVAPLVDSTIGNALDLLNEEEEEDHPLKKMIMEGGDAEFDC